MKKMRIKIKWELILLQKYYKSLVNLERTYKWEKLLINIVRR